ncbi:hypothetical protein TRM7615_04395 [Falsiruegeria mediterranea M17]|uniref:Uncharacterized protein n=1 Tax=Falsiruegeria mediterranea M17 TaxID=1200281 RepID=A0A2R8CEX6_9RHOB|nr:hypothetical protein TRM7615_04395 [Falsiruegeria mediterranea M17]
MTNLFNHVSLRRRISLTFWVLNIVLCLIVLVFVLR